MLQNEKSQLYGQIFIYILTVVLISFIVVYGYNAIQNLRDRADKISCYKFKNDLRNAVQSILSDFGSVKRKDLQLCPGYNQVCFVETFNEFDTQNLKSNAPIDPIIRHSIASNVGRNVFLVDNMAKESFYIGNISVNDDILCVSASDNRISLRLEGKGNNVLLGGWS